MHGTSCANHIVTWIHWFDKVLSRNLQANYRIRRWWIVWLGNICIMRNIFMFMWVSCIATPVWLHSYFGVTLYTQSVLMGTCLRKFGFWIIRRYFSIEFITHLIWTLFSCVRNNLLHNCAVVQINELKKSMSMITAQFCHCVWEICERLNFGTFTKFPCIT